LLAHIDQANLIAALTVEAIVPEAVAAEIQAGPAGDPARRWVEAGSIAVRQSPAPTPALLAWDLGAGETAVLAYAMATPGWTAVLDDAAARKCAQSFSVQLLGTLAIIVRAKQRGLIDSAANVIRLLQTVGFRIDDHIVRAVLKQAVQEEWPGLEE
jgi:predicted nucleic acid-binding protein